MCVDHHRTLQLSVQRIVSGVSHIANNKKKKLYLHFKIKHYVCHIKSQIKYTNLMAEMWNSFARVMDSGSSFWWDLILHL